METVLSPYRVDSGRPLIQRVLCRSLEEAVKLSVVDTACPQTEGWGTPQFREVKFVYLFWGEGWRRYNADYECVEPLTRGDHTYLVKMGKIVLRKKGYEAPRRNEAPLTEGQLNGTEVVPPQQAARYNRVMALAKQYGGDDTPRKSPIHRFRRIRHTPRKEG